jgi:hypothetical protein
VAAALVPGRKPPVVGAGRAVEHDRQLAHAQAVPGLVVVAQLLPVAVGNVVLQEELGEPVHAPDLDLGDIGAQAPLQRDDGEAHETEQQHDEQGGQRQEDLAGECQTRHGLRAGMAAFCDMRFGQGAS